MCANLSLAANSVQPITSHPGKSPLVLWESNGALGVIVRVCQAVAFALGKGVVHRRLKPSNAMVAWAPGALNFRYLGVPWRSEFGEDGALFIFSGLFPRAESVGLAQRRADMPGPRASRLGSRSPRRRL